MNKQANSKKTENTPWYKKWWGILLLIVIWPYFLIWYVWAKSNWDKNVRIGITIVACIAAVAWPVMIFSNPSQEPVQKKDTSQNKSSDAGAPKKETQPTESLPSYVVVAKSGNNIIGVTVAEADTTEEKLKLLGKKLNQDYGKYDFARVGVFRDSEHARIYTDPAAVSNLSDEKGAAYDKSHVAQFNVNAGTGFKQFSLYKPDGTSTTINVD